MSSSPRNRLRPRSCRVLAMAALRMLASRRVAAADTKLRGIAIDQRLDAEPLRPELSRAVPAIVRLSIDDARLQRFRGRVDARASAEKFSKSTDSRKTRVVARAREQCRRTDS